MFVGTLVYVTKEPTISCISSLWVDGIILLFRRIMWRSPFCAISFFKYYVISSFVSQILLYSCSLPVGNVAEQFKVEPGVNIRLQIMGFVLNKIAMMLEASYSAGVSNSPIVWPTSPQDPSALILY